MVMSVPSRPILEHDRRSANEIFIFRRRKEKTRREQKVLQEVRRKLRKVVKRQKRPKNPI